jgi:hypothetical protein
MVFDYHSRLGDKGLLQEMYSLLIEEQTMLLGEQENRRTRLFMASA